MTATSVVPFKVEARISLPQIDRGSDFGILNNHDLTHHPRSYDEGREEGRWIKRLRGELKPVRDQVASELSLILCFVPSFRHFMELILNEAGDFDYLLTKFCAGGYVLTLPGIEFVLKSELGRFVPDVQTCEPVGRYVVFPTGSHLVDVRKIGHRWALSEQDWNFQKKFLEGHNVPSWKTFAVLNYTGPDKNP